MREINTYYKQVVSLIAYLFLSLFLMSQLGFAQDNIFVGTLKDQKTKKSIKYASISINHSLYSVISNERGELNIKYTDKNDTLCINCFGYLIKRYTYS